HPPLAAFSARLGGAPGPRNRWTYRKEEVPLERPQSRAVSADMNRQVHDTPSQVSADEGTVKVDGPGDVDILLTPEAAAETSHRLLFGAAEARGQQISGEERDKPRL